MPSVSVWPYVLVWVGLKIILGVAVAWLADLTGGKMPGASARDSMALIVAVGWYAYKIDRPMQRREIVSFSIGVTLADGLMTMLVVGGSMLAGEEVISQKGGDLTFLLTFAILLTFLQSLFIAWLLTRKLPRRRKTG